MDSARGRAPQRLAAGVALGLRGLVSNTVYGFSNATAKMSGAARKVRLWNIERQRHREHSSSAVPVRVQCTSSIDPTVIHAGQIWSGIVLHRLRKVYGELPRQSPMATQTIARGNLAVKPENNRM
jgi:hypothetical protein